MIKVIESILKLARVMNDTLHEEILAGEKNVCYSPVGVYELLSIARDDMGVKLLGAMHEVLRSNDTSTNEKAKLRELIHIFYTDRTSVYDSATYNWKTKIFIPEHYVKLDELREAVKHYHAVRIVPGDANETSESVGIKTKTKCDTDLLATNHMGGIHVSGEDVVMVNDIYFDHPWEDEFDWTDDLKFNAKDKVVTVKMMGCYRKTSYYEDECLTAVRREYKNQKYGMLFILPKTDNDMKSLQDKLSNESGFIDELCGKTEVEPRYVNLTLPMFIAKCNADVMQVFGKQLQFDLQGHTSDITIMQNTLMRIDDWYLKDLVECDHRHRKAQPTDDAGAQSIVFDRPFVAILFHRYWINTSYDNAEYQPIPMIVATINDPTQWDLEPSQ